jgi:hypothetical protein
MRFAALVIYLFLVMVTDSIAGAGTYANIVKSVSFNSKAARLCALVEQNSNGEQWIYIVNTLDGKVLQKHVLKEKTIHVKYDSNGELLRFVLGKNKVLVKRGMSNKTEQMIKYPSKYLTILEVTDYWGPNYGLVLYGDTREYGKKYVYNNANGKITVIKNNGVVAFTDNSNVALCHNGSLDIIYPDGNINDNVAQCPSATQDKFKFVNQHGYFIAPKADDGWNKVFSIYDFEGNEKPISHDMGRIMSVQSMDMTETLVAYGGLDSIEVYEIKSGKHKYTVDMY